MRRKKRRAPTQDSARLLINVLLVLSGSAIVAFAFNLFLLPNAIASGGLSGFATIMYQVFGFAPHLTLYALNIPLFLLGMLLLGGFRYGGMTLVGTLFLPFVVFLTQHWPPLTAEPLLAAIFGGVGVGTGLGLVFRTGASTGGTDLAAQIIHKYTGVSLGAGVFIMDGLIVAMAAIAFSVEFALFALIGLFITGKTIDIVQTGFGYDKIAFIIAEEQGKIKEAILNDVDRGVTKLQAYGGYTEDDRPVLMCVVNRNEIPLLRQVVQTIDRDAFIVVSNATEVLGRGFKMD
ncbi:YitT family protein [Salicibibacter cibarius]|uniref:YitT family protein n=1 Tax=Salicibibacter cibarius TaxID=2743000 RepID=A0A7T6Z737_9BACI|nr:YitT family protein [Salicibibacter cibarius]QQK77892.1 YitT family protein [Salicibibacter cibarius]